MLGRRKDRIGEVACCAMEADCLRGSLVSGNVRYEILRCIVIFE